MSYTDLTGQKFGYLTVIEKAQSIVTPKGKKQSAWKVVCDCGTEKVVRGCDLKSGSIVSCGCYNKKKDRGKKQYIDLTGKRFGRLTVTGYAYTKNKKACWNCVCDCGNSGVFVGSYLRNGETKSCGCHKRDVSGLHNAIDLTGKKVGRLLVQYLSQKKPRKWHCVCECGNEVDVITNCLANEHTKSCGCLQVDSAIQKNIKDIAGQQFGFLTAIESAYHKKNVGFVWKCICKCGKECYVPLGYLTGGNTKSCGCLVSGVEEKIASLLSEYGVQFDRQKTFIGCKDQAKLKFDFYIPSMNLAIEYDGELHYKETSLKNNVQEQQRRDAIKTKYCEENDIILLRIPYWEKDNIESILTDWLFLYDTEDNNSSDVSLSA